MLTPFRQDPRPTLRRAPLAAAALLLALAGCVDVDAPTAPPAAADAAISADGLTPSATYSYGYGSGSRRWRGRHTPNHQRYRQRWRHGSGRSGAASVQAAATLAPNGTTWLTVTTGELDEPGRAPGRLEKVEVRVYGPDGDYLFTRKITWSQNDGAATVSLKGVPPGSRLRIQATVDGIRWRCTDTVTVWETVTLAPELGAELLVPEQTLVGAPTIITATVTELKGQDGVRADCQLWVDGVRVDVAEGIWVDAGDAVTCAFTHTFATTGQHTVEVRVVPQGNPGFDPAPAVSAAQVNVTTPNPAATFSASAEEKTVESSSVLVYQWRKPNGERKEYEDVVTNGQRSQSIVVNGVLARAAAFPLALVRVEVESNGVVYHDETWATLVGLPDPSGRLCLNQEVAVQGAMFHLCSSAGAGNTTFGYTRFGGTVTYHSRGFSRVWDGPSGEQTQNYTWNDQSEFNPTGGQIRPWGSDVRVRIRVTDVAGSYGVSPVIPLSPFESAETTPRTCTLDYHYWLEGNAQESCTWTETREFGRRGAAEG